MSSRTIYQDSLDYHRKKPYGKLEIKPTKPLLNRYDLSLAYSPGVAEPCRAIEKDPSQAATLTGRSNLIAVISNGTAVLGLGDIGALASKPVMEGKAVLFKKFSGIDAFDLEIDEKDPDRLVEIIASLEPTFGGINLEDIKAPECFYIEEQLKKRLKIPVFHDDQHGTAVIASAAVLNSLELQGKKIEEVRLVTSGAGAGALACIGLLVELGLKKENIILCDRQGVIYEGRPGLDAFKSQYAQKTPHRSLKDAIQGADIFLGLSTGGQLTEEMILTMAEHPIILAMANPEPEIDPSIVKRARPDAIIATGRSDFPNQVNNALCFPYLFRGALDVGATTINQEMKIACVHAIARLAKAESSEPVQMAYGGEVHLFGPDYIIPKPFDQRLFVEIAFAVAKAAMESGVATRPVKDLDAYYEELKEFVHRTYALTRPLFGIARGKADPVRVAYSEGEDPRVLQACQILSDEGLVTPVLIGRPDVIERRIKTLGLRLKLNENAHVIDPNHDERFTRYWKTYYDLMSRKGVSPEVAKTMVRTNTTVIASLMVHLGDAQGMVCGAVGRYLDHFRVVRSVLGLHPDSDSFSTVSAALWHENPIFFCDPYIQEDPQVEELVEMTLMAADQLEYFGLTPKIAFVSHSNFGTSRLPSAEKMREAIQILREMVPELEIEGEMHMNCALDPEVRQKFFPESKLTGIANLLIFPNIESANICFNLAKTFCDERVVGPILLGCSKPAHILPATSSTRDIINISALLSGSIDSFKED